MSDMQDRRQSGVHGAMPESAPLDVTEATIGYELDAITLRNIASVRYVRHHEWLDHVLGSPLPTSAIVPPKISSSLSLDDIKSQIERAEEEIAVLEAEKEKGWSFHVDEEKARVLSEAIHTLRTDFGSEAGTKAKFEAENILGLKMAPASPMRAVEITYNRQAVDSEQAQLALEKQKRQAEEVEQQNNSFNEVNGEQPRRSSDEPQSGLDNSEEAKDHDESAMLLDD